MNPKWQFFESHFASLPSQSNIYGFTQLPVNGGGWSKILVASLKRRMFSLEYTKSLSGEISPTVTEIEFTYIPSTAEIISIDAFCKTGKKNEYVVGITLIKSQENQVVYYFNVYSEKEPVKLENLAQFCQSLELSYVPYHLYHTDLHRNNVSEHGVLLSGSDKQVHLYLEKHNICYESPVLESFPEFFDLPSIVMWMDILYINNCESRLTAFACEDGYLRATLVDVATCQVSNTWNICHDGPLTCIRWFTYTNVVTPPSHLGNKLVDKIESIESGTPQYHIVVTSALEPSVVYNDVLHCGFEKQSILPESDKYDCVNCCRVVDVDMDGENEILLGTYGQELLAYKLEKHPASGTSRDVDPTYQLLWRYSFSHPILHVDYFDVTGDGMNELIVLSTRGIHVLQHDLKQVQELCSSRLQKLLSMLKE